MTATITLYMKEDFKVKYLEGIIEKIELIIGSYIKDIKVSEGEIK